jgi:WD40 repeat protein
MSGSGHISSFTDCADSKWEFVLWSMPEGIPLGTIRYDNARRRAAVDTVRHRRVMIGLRDGQASVDAVGHDGTVKHLGTLKFQFPTTGEWRRNLRLDGENGRWLAVVADNELMVIEIGDNRLSEPRRVWRVDHGVADFGFAGRWLAALVDDEILVFDIDDDRLSQPTHVVRVGDGVTRFALDSQARFVATSRADNTIRLWSLAEVAPPLVLEGPKGANPRVGFSGDGSRIEAWAEDGEDVNVRFWGLSGPLPRFLRDFTTDISTQGFVFDPAGKNVVEWGTGHGTLVWAMDAPVDAEPLVLLDGGVTLNQVSFNPLGGWLATATRSGPLALWPLAKPFPSVIRQHDQDISNVQFAPDGSWLASSSADGTVKLWPLVGNPPPPGRTLLEMDWPRVATFLAASPDGSRILAASSEEGVWLLRSDGEAPSHLGGFKDYVGGVAFSADGRLAAAAGGEGALTERVIRVWDVEAEEEVRVLDVGEQVWPDNIAFTPDGHLLSSSESGLLRWDVWTGEREVLYEGDYPWFSASADGRRVLLVDEEDRVLLLDVDSGIAEHLDGFSGPALLDPRGTLVVNPDEDGGIRVGRVNGTEPHLLLGHEGPLGPVAIDPLGRWIASGGSDKTVRLWPMPDLDKPPLHTLAREELIAKLKTLTNLRVVRDRQSPTGWKLTVGPFPGWETVPEW